MQLEIAYFVLGALAAMTSASPIDSTPTESAATPLDTAEVVDQAGARAQADLTVKICTDNDFKGLCGNFATTRRICYNLGADYSDKVSSFGPERGWTCKLWEDANCKGNYKENIKYPGISNLKDYKFDDVVSSYLCY